MNFRIADTFIDSLARLTGEEQKAVKTTASDLQLNPASPGHSFPKLDKAKDRNFLRSGGDTSRGLPKRKVASWRTSQHSPPECHGKSVSVAAVKEEFILKKISRFI